MLCIDPEQRPNWLDAVYSDETLVTKVRPIPLSRAFRPATGWMYTSSSTMPSLVLRMLETLDVRDGQRVLEIGTGSVKASNSASKAGASISPTGGSRP